MKIKPEWIVGAFVTFVIGTLSFLAVDKVNAITVQGNDNSKSIGELQLRQAVADERYIAIDKKIDMLLSKNGLIYRNIQGSVASTSSISKE